jgi:hypothetical protein
MNDDDEANDRAHAFMHAWFLRPTGRIVRQILRHQRLQRIWYPLPQIGWDQAALSNKKQRQPLEIVARKTKHRHRQVSSQTRERYQNVYVPEGPTPRKTQCQVNVLRCSALSSDSSH